MQALLRYACALHMRRVVKLVESENLKLSCVAITHRFSAEGNAIGSVRVSVSLFALYLLNRLTCDLHLLHVYAS